MPGFIRYFLSEPTRDELEAIEGVSLIEILPTTLVEGAGPSVAAIVGEFEDGPFNTPTEILKPIDLTNTFGGFGFTHDGKPYQNPVARRSGGSELWNGNGILALYGKKFPSPLVVVRVNTSAGKVQFSRQACLTATRRGPFDLEPGDACEFEVDGASRTATIAAVAGQIDATGGVYPTLFTGVEYLIFEDEFGNQTKVQFAATDQALADVIAAINKQLAYTAASNNGGQLRLVSKVRGQNGYIELVGGTGSAITQLGLTLTNTAEVDRVTIVNNVAGLYSFSVTVLHDGVITVYVGEYTAGGGDTKAQIQAALISDFETTNPDAPVTLAANATDKIDITSDVAGIGILTAIVSTPNPGDFTTANVTPNSTSYGWGNGNVADVDRITDAEVAAMFEALTGITSYKLSTGYVRACNDATPVTGTLEFITGALGTALGWTAGLTANANAASRITIPAGTRVEDTAGYRWVTMLTTTTDTTGGPFSLDVRPAQDDDTTPTAGAGTATTLVDVLADGFVVDNSAQLQRLSPGGFDAAYRAALAKTLDPGGKVAPKINIIFAARTSYAIMQNLAQNAIDASAKQHALRKPILGAKVGLTVNQLLTDDNFGVPVAGADSRVFYAGPEVLVYVPMIAELGDEGGVGFNDDGLIDQHFDSWYASIRSILPPEENAGQDLRFVAGIGKLRSIVGLGRAFNSEYGGTPLDMEDYIAFAEAGIIAPMMDPVAGCTVQSDVTTMPQSSNVEAHEANYRFMFDYIGDSLRDIARPYVKTLKKPVNRTGLLAAVDGFLRDLLSENNPDLARIAGYNPVVDQTSATLAAKGNRDLRVEVKLLQTDKFINFRLTVGTSVELSTQ